MATIAPNWRKKSRGRGAGSGTSDRADIDNFGHHRACPARRLPKIVGVMGASLRNR